MFFGIVFSRSFALFSFYYDFFGSFLFQSFSSWKNGIVLFIQRTSAIRNNSQNVIEKTMRKIEDNIKKTLNKQTE